MITLIVVGIGVVIVSAATGVLIGWLILRMNNYDGAAIFDRVNE